MKKFAFSLIFLMAAPLSAAVSMIGQRLRIAEVDYSTYGYPTTLAFQDGQLSCAGSTCTVTITGGGGGGSGTLEVLFPGILSSSPTFTINFDTTVFRGTDSGSTATVRINFSSITAMGDHPSDPRYTLFFSTAEGKINGAGGFTLFLTTGQSQIAAAGGFTLFKSTAEQKINDAGGFTLFIATFTPGGGGGPSFRIETTTIAIVNGNSEGGLESKDRTVNSFQNFGSTTMYTDTANRVIIGTAPLGANVTISSGPGVTQPLIIIATGTTKLFEVTGSSVVINTGVGLNIDAGQVVIGNNGTVSEGGVESTLVVRANKNVNSVGSGITALTPDDTKIARYNAIADNVQSRIATFGGSGESSPLFVNSMFLHNRNFTNGIRFFENSASDNNNRPVILITTTSLIQIGASTMTPVAKLMITSGTNNGSGSELNTVEALLVISSGSGLHNNYTDMRVMEVGKSSASFRIPLYLPSIPNCNTVDTDSEGQLICGTDEGGAGAGADGNLTNVATQPVNLGGFALFNVSSMSMSGAGAPIIGSTFSLVQFQVTDGVDIDFEVNESSVVVSTTSNNIFNTTDTYNLNERILQVLVSTGLENVSSGTVANNGANFSEVIFESALSTSSQRFITKTHIGKADGTNPRISYSQVNSTGLNPQEIRFTVAFSTTTGGTHAPPTIDSLIWSSTFTLVCSTPGYSSVEHIGTTTPEVAIGSLIGSGYKMLYTQFINTADIQGAKRAIQSVLLEVRKRH